MSLSRGDASPIFKSKLHKEICPKYNAQLINLFSMMCTNIANGTNTTLRDACIGCFQSATTTTSQPSIASIIACANIYASNTNYSSCFNILPPTTVVFTPGIDPRIKRSPIQCNTEYCQFARCIRSVNANILISRCYNESRLINPAVSAVQQVNLYKNITACILARARCSSVNPITGQPQNGRYQTITSTDHFGKTTQRTTTYYYSLQISLSGELRIVALPNAVASQNGFCATQSSLQEANWMTFTC
nr:uncharacterized protein LOC111425456 [Onthophagus taurus]